MSDPRWCEQAPADVGFADVTVGVEHAPFPWDSGRDCARSAWESLPPSVQQILADWLDSADRAAIREELIGAADACRESDGQLRLPSTVLCLRAVKPASARR